MKFIFSFIYILFLQFFTTNISAQNVGIGTSTPQSKLSVGSNSEFRVDAVGNIVRINNVPVSFPSAQGANGQTLTNNGSGNLSWTYPAVKNSIILAQAADTASLKLQGFSVLKQHENQADTLLDSIAEVLSGTWQFNTNLNTFNTFQSVNETPISGTNLYQFGYDSSVYEYNTTTNLYTQLPNKAPLHFRDLPSITVVNNEVYIMGGFANIGTLESPDLKVYNDGAKYNLTTHVWIAMPIAPLKMTDQAAVVLGNNIYYIGGADSINNFLYLAHPMPVLKYNTVTKVWSDETPPDPNSRVVVQGEVATNGSNIYIAPFGKDSIYEFQTGSGNLVPLVKYSSTKPEVISSSIMTYGNSNLYKIDTYSDTLGENPEVRRYKFYKINPATGQTTELNHCGMDDFGTYGHSLTYNSTANVFYFVINNVVNKFSPVATTSTCKTYFTKQHPWYYMKKN